MTHFAGLEWSKQHVDDSNLPRVGDLPGSSSWCRDFEADSSDRLSLSILTDISQMSLLSVVTASLRFLFLLRQVGLLDRTSFQIWSRWLIGWSESAPEPTDLSVTKQPNTFAESRSRVTAFSRSISCRESGFAPANVVDWESWRVLSAIFCSMTFNCLLLDFRSEMRWPSVEWISYTTKCRQTNCAACSGKTQYVPLQVVTYMNIFLNLKLKHDLRHVVSSNVHY